MHGGGGKSLVINTLGLSDWYVICILIFYSLFYLANYLSAKLRLNVTAVLSIFMLLYFAIAYSNMGMENAHWFRYPWVFVLGHIIAKGKNNKMWANIFIMGLFTLTLLFLCHVNKVETRMCACYAVALLGLIGFSCINRHYHYNGNVLLFIGGISYFFYLSHVRIAYALMNYCGCNSIVLWIATTILISCGLKHLYNRFPLTK